MNAGELNRRVTIERPPVALDGYGQPTGAWSAVATVWANVRMIGGRERLRAGALESDLAGTVAVRYQAAFLPLSSTNGWRINHGGRLLNITAARDLDEAHEWIIFDVSEGSADGS